MPKLVCCFESLNYIAPNYSQSTTNEDLFQQTLPLFRNRFYILMVFISRKLYKDHLNNIMLHLAGTHMM